MSDMRERDLRTGLAGDFYSGQRASLADDLGITAETTDDELAVIAERETKRAAAQDPPQIVSGIEEYLRELRDVITSTYPPDPWPPAPDNG